MSWWAAYTRGGRTLAARDELERRGVPVFCPVERIRRRTKVRNRNKYRIHHTVSPVFGHYIFCEGREAELSALPWISGLVKAGTEAVRVPDRVMLMMKELTSRVEGVGDVMGERDLTALRTGFTGAVGDHFRFTEGAFSGYYGIIASLERLDGSGVIRAYIDIFGRRSEVQVHRSAIRPLPKAEQKALMSA